MKAEISKFQRSKYQMPAKITDACFGLWLLAFGIFDRGGGMMINFKVPNVQISKLSAEIAGICFGVWLLAFEIFPEDGAVKTEIPNLQRFKSQNCPLRSQVFALAFGHWLLRFPTEVDL